MILGIDEVGRGPWAGPLVVGAVVLGGAQIKGLNDSKQLTKKRREELDILIRERAAGFGLGWVSATELDEIGLSESLRTATRRAVEQIHTPFHEIIIDGTINFLSDTKLSPYVKTLKKADALIPSVSAASIIAKVARDNFMASQDEKFPGYNFGSHVGYGTAAHRAAIEKFGVCELHRLSFAPLKKYRQEANETKQNITQKKSTKISKKSSSNTRAIGDVGELTAAAKLERLGHEIVARNWRTKYCEIDIVSRKGGTYYFTEVKYRKNADFGDGLSAITAKKLKQMNFAARIFAHANGLSDTDLRLLAISVSGNPPKIDAILDV